MKKTLKKQREISRKLLFLALSSFLLLHPIFHEYNGLMHIECLLPLPTFENPHPEDMVAGKHDHFQGLDLVVSISSFMPPMAAGFFIRIGSLSFPFLYLEEHPILRC